MATSRRRIWNRALSADEVVHAFAQAPAKGSANMFTAGCSRTGDRSTSLDEPDGRLTVFQQSPRAPTRSRRWTRC